MQSFVGKSMHPSGTYLPAVFLDNRVFSEETLTLTGPQYGSSNDRLSIISSRLEYTPH
jgi:hypothetical protein